MPVIGSNSVHLVHLFHPREYLVRPPVNFSRHPLLILFIQKQNNHQSTFDNYILRLGLHQLLLGTKDSYLLKVTV